MYKVVSTAGVLAQREMEKRRSPLVQIPPLRAGDFQGMRVYRPMTFLVVSVQRERIGSRAAKHRLDEPAGYPSAWLHPCRACLRFTRQVHFSSAARPAVFNFHRENQDYRTGKPLTMWAAAANRPSFLRFGLRGLLLWPRAACGRDDTIHPQVLDHLTVVILRMEGADDGDCETR
jgi:hypothetical protein